MHTPLWKKLLVVVLCVLGLYYAAPNMLSEETRKSLGSFLPSKTVNLGLDLQGGSHLLLEVDVKTGMRDYFANTVDSIRKLLRAEQIGYLDLALMGDKIYLSLSFPSQAKATLDALKSLRGEFDVKQIPGSDLFEITMSETERAHNIKRIVDQSIEVIERRINELGTREPTIQRQGEDRILVQLPGEQDPNRAKNVIGKTAKLTLRLVHEDAPYPQTVNNVAPPGTEILPSDDGHFDAYVVKKEVLLGGENLVDARPSTDQYNKPQVAFRLDTIGGKKFAEITANYVGHRLAIVLDGRVISAPNIQGQIPSGDGVITGKFTMESANDLALLMRAGALVAPLTILEERTVGPDLGADSIQAGERATIYAVVLVVIFMIVAYSLFGLVANIALIFNLIMLIGALSLIEATLTLPGIAGIALTLGMAVDANVLINERIKEELRNGRKVAAAIDAGYERAIATILDSNITTVIGAAALFFFGSGPIKGFGVTLTIGILISMFTAITLTRVVVNGWYNWRKPKTLPI